MTTRPTRLRFFVAGIPGPSGSKRMVRAGGMGRWVLIDMGGTKTRRWRVAVAQQARAAMRGAPWAGPVRLEVRFVVPRGRTVTRAWPTVAPDTTKLLRATEDALSRIVWCDDAQVVEQRATKRYAAPDGVTGAWITVSTVEGPPGRA